MTWLKENCGATAFWLVVATVAWFAWFSPDDAEPANQQQNFAPSFNRTDDPTQQRSFGQYGDVDCTDFSSQVEAQDFFESEGGPNEDYHNLDRDGDGIACESN